MREKFITTNELDTFQLGRALGSVLRGTEVCLLQSDVGGGKTTLTRGIVAGLGSRDTVSSPTFTFENRYAGEKNTIYHYDFYRITEAGLLKDELQEALEDTSGIIVIEWAGVVEDVIDFRRLLTITIDKDPKQEETRVITLNTSDSLDYIIKDLQNV